MPQTRPVIRKGRKFEQVLEGARSIFLRDGFEGASVDDIAAAAGVSKATLYSYFPDKRLLFLEAAKSECARQADESVNPMPAAASARDMLRHVGGKIVDFISSDFGMAMFRIGVAEAQRFPEIGREFYQTGPLLLRQRLGAHLRDFVARGDLAIEDIDLAADQFAELCKADIHGRLILGVTQKVSPRDARRIIDGAVEMFLARYARR